MTEIFKTMSPKAIEERDEDLVEGAQLLMRVARYFRNTGNVTTEFRVYRLLTDIFEEIERADNERTQMGSH